MTIRNNHSRVTIRNNAPVWVCEGHEGDLSPAAIRALAKLLLAADQAEGGPNAPVILPFFDPESPYDVDAPPVSTEPS